MKNDMMMLFFEMDVTLTYILLALMILSYSLVPN